MNGDFRDVPRWAWRALYLIAACELVRIVWVWS